MNQDYKTSILVNGSHSFYERSKANDACVWIDNRAKHSKCIYLFEGEWIKMRKKDRIMAIKTKVGEFFGQT